eukprot:3912208-Pleurochrysis_carterae.AAC.1
MQGALLEVEADAGEQAGKEQEGGGGRVEDGGPARARSCRQISDAAQHQGLWCAQTLQGLGAPARRVSCCSSSAYLRGALDAERQDGDADHCLELAIFTKACANQPYPCLAYAIFVFLTVHSTQHTGASTLKSSTCRGDRGYACLPHLTLRESQAACLSLV